MQYSNPELPEGINTSKDHPLKEFFILTMGILSIFILVLLILSYLANHFASAIPFKAEVAFTNEIKDHFFTQKIKKNSDQKTQQYLQDLANKLSKAEALPKSMKIIVHYQADETINAFATLGGHIFMFKGLLQKLPNENAVAMVLAHEIAHIKNRHPIKGMGRGIVIGLALTMINGSIGNSLAEQAFSGAGGLTGLTFSRDQEMASDNEALQALLKYYGHVNGARALFDVLEKENQGIQIPAFLSTHPLSIQRIEYINQFQQQHQEKQQDLTPLPAYFLK